VPHLLAIPLQERLQQGALALGVALSPGQERALLDYLSLISKWNGVYNLTAVRDPSQMLSHHILDALAIVPLIAELAPGRLLDVGTGAGLPGIVLAIALPQLNVTLLDAVQKKTAFLTQVKSELGLSVTVQHARVEALTGTETYDCIVSRAFSSLAELVTLCAGRLARGGAFVAMKGAPTDAELAALPPPWTVERNIALHVPFLDAARCALVIRSGNLETL
jgi:16S rRNA (guanine527-N7)-methyltransferase